MIEAAQNQTWYKRMPQKRQYGRVSTRGSNGNAMRCIKGSTISNYELPRQN